MSLDATPPPPPPLPASPPTLPPPPPLTPLPEGIPVLTYKAPAEYALPAEWTNVEVFGLRPETLRKFLVIILTVQFGMSLAMGVGITAIAGVFQDNWQQRLVMGAVTVTMMLVYATVMSIREVIRTRRQWPTFRLFIADQGLRQVDPPKPAITVLRQEVRAIREDNDTFLLELGLTYVNVPKRAERPDRIRERLAAWRPLQPPQSRAKNIMDLTWLTLCPVACVGVAVLGTQSQSVAVVAACSVVAMTLSIAMAVGAWRRVTLSLWTKIGSLILVVAALQLPLRLLWMILFA